MAYSMECPHEDMQGKNYTLIDVPVYGEHTEPNPVFVTYFSREL